ncbi:hypothetical protein HMPREF1872_01232 [Amygdalobacter nucleatus]|uniref:Uncharacterized protein n=2 Tax=Amygdalobacter nucleatus TaxID=3029274 RepID=A0A133Y7S6_9FIRM|nr:hypothetical protein HMPREF1872_01232 [Amygdalobacter nucleatus]
MQLKEANMADQHNDKKAGKLENKALAYDHIAFDSQEFLSNNEKTAEENTGDKEVSADAKLDLSSFNQQQRELDFTNKKLVILYVIKAIPNIKQSTLRDICLQSNYLNYFTFIACLDELKQSKLVDVKDDIYTLTTSGTTVFDTLELTLPNAAYKFLDQLIANFSKQN